MIYRLHPIRVPAALLLLFSFLAIVPLPAQEPDADAQAKPADEAQFLTRIRQLTFEGRRAGEGYFSPDGRHMIFQSERDPKNPFYQIYLLDMEEGDVTRVSPGTGNTTCAFIRPNSNQVLFGSTHLDPLSLQRQQAELDFRASGKERRYAWNYEHTMDIFAANRDGSNLTQLTTANGYDAEAAYSPDGSKIVFCSLRDIYKKQAAGELTKADQERLKNDPAFYGEVYIMNADGSGQTRLTDWPGYDGGTFFSPDGERIIFRHFEENGAIADVYTMKTDGTDKQRVTTFGCMSWAPYYHPSGDYIFFAANKLGFSNFEVFIVDTAGAKEPVRVTHTDGFDGLPVPTPNGKMLCWTSTRTPKKQSQLFLANWDHDAALAALEAAQPRTNHAAAVKDAPKVTGHCPIEGAGTAKAGHKPHPLPKRSPDILAADLRADATFLASDELEGRLTGTPGAARAAAYLARSLHAAGFKPAGDPNEKATTPGAKSYRHQFRFSTSATPIAAKTKLNDATLDTDFRPLPLSSDGTLTNAPLAFAGYGIKIPGGTDNNPYADLDVAGKAVLVLQHNPETVTDERRRQLRQYAGLAFKASIAKAEEATALLVITQNPDDTGLIAPTYNYGSGQAGIPVLAISQAYAEALIGTELAPIIAKADKEENVSTDLESTLTLAVTLDRKTATDHNVLGILPVEGATETILLGGHYDHIGRGDVDSLARAGEEGDIHNGADDNASGCAVLLELAAALAADQADRPERFRRNIAIAFWSGEELGLLGSTAWAESPTLPLDTITAYLNFDMVGRLRENKLMLQGAGSSTAWKRLIEKRNILAGFQLRVSDDPYLPTDATALYPKGVPVLSFFTGAHDDYNRPTDDPDTLNYEGMERIAAFARRIILDLAKAPERPAYVKVAPASQRPGGRRARRAFLGTIPSYAGGDDIKGLLLSGVKAGGPAEKSGMKGGDIIVEFNGKEIKNIYDFAYGLDGLEVGKATPATVLRDGKRVKLTIIPEERK